MHRLVLDALCQKERYIVSEIIANLKVKRCGL